MSIVRPQFVNGEIYHVITRGVGDITIFNKEDDYYRGIFSIYEFNTDSPIEIREQRKKRKIIKASGGQSSDIRNKLVDILSFCFMPNHIHLLVRQLRRNGMTDFMRKAGTGYASYFNKKYNRKGHLFQGRYNAIHIKDDEQLKTVFAYIHTNPLSLIYPNWKEIGIKDSKKAIKFLEDYKWSSYKDYIGIKNFPSVTERDFLLKVMGQADDCKKFVDNWIKFKEEINKSANTIFLE